MGSLKFRLTAEHLELNPYLVELGKVEGDVVETSLTNVHPDAAKVGPRPGDKNKNVESEESEG